MRGIAADAAGTTVVLTTHRGLYRTADGGQSWRFLEGNLPVHLEARPLVRDPSHALTLYAGYALMPYSELWRRALEGSNLLSRVDPVSLAGALAFLLLLAHRGRARRSLVVPPPHACSHSDAEFLEMNDAPVPSALAPRRRAGLLVGLVVVVILAAAVAAWQWFARPQARFVEYPMLEPSDVPTAIAASPDGGVWFTIDSANAIGRVRDGKLERFVEEQTNGEPIGIATAADGSAWYTDGPAGQITRISPNGELSSVPLDRPLVRIGQIAMAPDGALWFTEASAYSITRLKDGKFERHVIDRIRGVALGVAVAGDGAVWVTLQAANQLLRIAPDGSMQTFDIPTRGSSPGDVAVGKDGAVWFLEFRGNKVGRFADGRFEEFPVGAEQAGLTGLAVAADGAIWFGMLRRGSLGRLKDGKLEEFRLPRKEARPYSVAVDRDGNVWYTDIRGFVGMVPAADAKR